MACGIDEHFANINGTKMGQTSSAARLPGARRGPAIGVPATTLTGFIAVPDLSRANALVSIATSAAPGLECVELGGLAEYVESQLCLVLCLG
jgi:hypothetical protein